MAAPKPKVNKSQFIRDYFKQNPTAHAKEVVTVLATKGITVTESHVYVVKGKMKLKKLRKAKKAAASENGTPKKAKTPTSPEAPNKTQAVRVLLKQTPKATVEEVISTLAAKGIEVKKGLVYLVKSSMKSKKRRQKREKVATDMVTATSSSSGSGIDPLTAIKQIKGLAAELGGMKKLRALVEALSE
jgi:arginine repressor